ncbi:MAG: ABC transporter ATP-binding protein [Pseudomonadota bacterium]
MNVIDINDLVVEFSGSDGVTRAVNGVSFSIPQGRTVALVGESGSGKTVISQTIMGLLPPSANIARGEVLFRDPASGGQAVDIATVDAESKAMKAIRGDRISIVFQEPMTSLSPLHTIGDQLGEVVRLHRGVSRSEARSLTVEMLRLVQFPDPERGPDIYPFELSGGLRQRAMIAMALMCRPALLIADEPTTALDVTIQAEILKLMRDIQVELDMSVLLITHDFGVVANMADDVVVVYHGRVMEAGDADTIFRSPQHAYLKALMGAVPRFDMGDEERLKPIRPIEAKAGESLRARANSTEPPPAGETILDLKDVSKVYRLKRKGGMGGGTRVIKAMDAVNLTVKCGECVGLVGESGSGKTTTAKAIMRAIDIDRGAIDYRLDKDLIDVSRLRGPDLMAFRRDVQMVFQDPFSSLNPRMTVNDILQEPFIIHEIGTREERAERVRDLMTLVGLDQRMLRRYPHSFSGGQRQRIGIARALALSPDFLLCDEPVSALDVSVQAQILNLLRDLKSELSLTYLFVSHNLAVVDYIADRIAVMCKGRIVEVGPKQAVIEDAQHPYTQALLSAIPEPDLDQRLDFNMLADSRASDPGAWDKPYRLTDNDHPTLEEVTPGHFVCRPVALSDIMGEAV